MKVNTGGTNPEGSGGQFVDKAGIYHLTIVEQAIEEAGNSGGQVLRNSCEVLGSEHADQVGKQIKYDLFLPEGSQYPEDNANALLRFGCALGIYSKAQWDADIKAGVSADVPVDEAAGLQFVAKVEMKPDKTDKDKHWARVTRIYAVGDDDAQGAPMSKPHLAIFNGKLPMSAGGFRGGQSGGATPAATVQPQASAPVAASAATNDDDLF